MGAAATDNVELERMTRTSKAPEHLAWACLVVGAVLSTVAVFVGRWSGYTAVWTVGCLIANGVLIWFVLALHLRLRRLAYQEQLDTAHWAQGRQSSSIFQAEAEQSLVTVIARRRLEVFERWFIPIFGALIAAVQIGLGWVIWRYGLRHIDAQAQSPLVAGIIMAAVAFVCFLLSRYATGMSAQPAWRPLRAGGSAYLAVAVAAFVLAIGLGFAQFQVFWLERAVAYAVAALLVVLGLETLLNVVLDIYRPRVEGQYDRAPFDSRLLGLINEPGSILQSLASALDYQFGFKVSQTWFYKLLERAIVPLFLFGVGTLYMASCIAVIQTDQQAIIERLGRPIRQVRPGMHIKWPWPFEVVRAYTIGRIMELPIGYKPKLDPAGFEQRSPLLWNKPHYEEEHSLLVASETGQGPVSGQFGGALPVSLVKANVPVHYRVKDLRAFLYNYSDPQKTLEAICYQQLTVFGASATIETDQMGSSRIAESLLGGGRDRARKVLMQMIQEAADEAGLGVEIVFVGVQGIHPPVEVVPEYQAVVGAVQEKQALIFNALGQQNEDLSGLVGSVEQAYALYDLATRYQQASRQSNQAEDERLGAELDRAFGRAVGEVYRILREAKAYAYRRAKEAYGVGIRFRGQLEAYRAAPKIFVRQQRLQALAEAISPIRKYAVLAEPNDREVTIVDLQDKLMPNVYDIGPLQEQRNP
ncbi:MAG: SPFH domain-containing protein [Sedimentisphaerales bacterium]|nr:SPFH domain-containing protein [Sedimentisphaerales bacterium]